MNMSRSTFQNVVEHAIGDAENLNQESASKLREVAKTTTACAVAFFGDPLDPKDCQCPATQAGLNISEGGIIAFAYSFDDEIERLAGHPVGAVYVG